MMQRGFQTTSALSIGAVLLLIGIIGFVNDPILGLFDVNDAHNLVHVLTGAVGIVCAAWGGSLASRWCNRASGIVYSAVAVFGFAGIVAAINLLALNGADNWLHVILGVVQLIVGFGMKD